MLHSCCRFADFLVNPERGVALAVDDEYTKIPRPMHLPGATLGLKSTPLEGRVLWFFLFFFFCATFHPSEFRDSVFPYTLIRSLGVYSFFFRPILNISFDAKTFGPLGRLGRVRRISRDAVAVFSGPVSGLSAFSLPLPLLDK